MTKNPLYLTTTLPYVNSDPHIGFALEIVHADIVARFAKLQGREVFFNTGTDEHGQKIHDAAKKAGLETQVYVDQYAEKFRGLKAVLGLSEDVHFIRTSSPEHKAAAQEFWRRCMKAGDIYKKIYQSKYCVGCELSKTDSELEGGKCPIHPNLEIQLIDEENYFFRFSKYQQALLDLYSERPDFLVPDFRFNEIKAFVARGLEDFSISRLKTKMPWGVPLPEQPADEPEQVMYVWFDALVSYISTLGWPGEKENFKKWWTNPGGVVHYAGKDQMRMQAAMWQAMLMSARAGSPEDESAGVALVPSKQIVIHGFITSGGQKMSKSLGNVINPYDLMSEYGVDAMRCFLAKEVHPFEDSDVTLERVKDSYNANLANGLGNLLSRIMKMATANGVVSDFVPVAKGGKNSLIEKAAVHIDVYEVNKAIEVVFGAVTALDQFIQKEQPFKTVKVDAEKGKQQIAQLVRGLGEIGEVLAPFMPETSAKILECVEEGKMPETALFLRKE